MATCLVCLAPLGGLDSRGFLADFVAAFGGCTALGCGAAWAAAFCGGATGLAPAVLLGGVAFEAACAGVVFGAACFGARGAAVLCGACCLGATCFGTDCFGAACGCDAGAGGLAPGGTLLGGALFCGACGAGAVCAPTGELSQASRATTARAIPQCFPSRMVSSIQNYCLPGGFAGALAGGPAAVLVKNVVAMNVPLTVVPGRTGYFTPCVLETSVK